MRTITDLLHRPVMRRARSENGSMVVDVLIGMAIFALIAIIAVSGYRQWRDRAYAHAVLTDADRLARAIELLMSDPQFEVSAGPGMSITPRTVEIDPTFLLDPLDATGITLSESNEVFGWKVVPETLDFGFCIEHVPSSPGAWAAYRSDLGGVYAHGAKGGCQGPDAPDWTGYLPGYGDTDPSQTPTPEPTPVPSETPIPEPTPVPSETPIPEPTPVPSETVSPTPETTPSPAPTPGPSPEPTPTSEPTPTPTPSPTVTPTPTPTPSPTPSPSPAPAPPSWTAPKSAADIEALCAKNWGSKAIRGTGSVIRGTNGPDIIFAGNGGQTIYGLGGDDLICGGNGKDVIYGGSGSDVLFGGNGKDTLYGGAGKDYLHGNNGKDTMYVGDGFEDVAYGGNGADVYLEDGPTDPEDTFIQ